MAALNVAGSCIALQATIKDFNAGKITRERAGELWQRQSDGASSAADKDSRYLPIAVDFIHLVDVWNRSPTDVPEAYKSLTMSCAKNVPWDDEKLFPKP